MPLATDELPRTSGKHLGFQGFQLVGARALFGARFPDSPLLASAGLPGPDPACCLPVSVSTYNSVLMRTNKCAHRSLQLSSSVNEAIRVHAPASVPLLRGSSRGSRTTLLSFVHTLLGNRGRSLEGPTASLYLKNQVSTSREFFVQLLVHPLWVFHRLFL